MQLDWLHFGTLVACAHVLGIFAACHAILYTRTSQGAIAWAVSLIAMPHLTLVPYLFLGRSRFKGYVDARRVEYEAIQDLRLDLVNNIHQKSDLIDNDPVNQLGIQTITALSLLARMSLSTGNHVRTLVNGEATFSAIFDAINAARYYVLIQFFIIRADIVGDMLRDILIAKAAQGVRVHLLYDSVGSIDLPVAYLSALRAGSVEVHAFTTNRRFIHRFQLNFRNHRKIVVVDGECAFIGGHNIGIEYLGGKPSLSPWRDTHIEVRGPVVKQIEFVFVEDWFWATQRLPYTTSSIRPCDGNMHCQVIASGPADRQETCLLFFVASIHAARERIWITSPYLIPDEAVFSALRLAVMRGVDVRVLIPSRRDHIVVFEASRLYAHDMVHAGIQIFRYRPGFLHQKVILIDSVAAAVGSANLDNRSFRLNFEIMLLIVNSTFALEVSAMLEVDFALSDPVQANEYQQTPAWRRMAMHVARLFSPIL
ncbi:cardiolipin synthase [Candidatus Vallotia lariciata]|uniref:cardiolipin synthase n=1 Tax=Candidatus Vallotia laricis TaxID=2018052 RepID=UPI001D0151F7|nr:cardiolipin synthase [Candidatus Vallotia lariciata]UDG83065.1 putative cardiolipin synthase YwiE [Candidatus Vallotia lariciata]